MCVSVLMSVYHGENKDSFQKALESVWDAQTLKPSEIVLVEDGPLTGELYEVIDMWEYRLGGKLKRVVLEENKGLSAALNLGIDHCSSPYVARMDTDDIAASERFEKQVAFLQDNPDVHVVGGSVQWTRDDGSVVVTRTYPPNTEQAKKQIPKATPLSHPTVMFSRRVFDDGMRYPEKHRTCQDIEFWFNLLNEGYKIGNIRDVAIYSRVREGLADRRSKSRAGHEFRIYFSGILNLYGFTWRLIFPFLRLGFRMCPRFLIKKIYASRLRAILNRGRGSPE